MMYNDEHQQSIHTLSLALHVLDTQPTIIILMQKSDNNHTPPRYTRLFLCFFLSHIFFLSSLSLLFSVCLQKSFVTMTRITMLLLLLVSLAATMTPVAMASQTVSEAARFARQVVSDAGVGTFLTKMQEPMFEEGYPFGIMEYYSGDCTDQPGDLLLYMSDLQMSVRNMRHDPDHVAFTVRSLKVYDNPKMGNGSSLVELPRLTLFGSIEPLPRRKHQNAMTCYYDKHPDTKGLP
ncbi:pyridoxamine 5'-phosphate oxidase-domain-containing protein [Zychaea mexicana]|uniref:pyridoxamine 5'-phosphate oxidase-domain-containing protein n=1 Tax=Zychaea mexicana TaxID=64656 RepID=UPI0022FEBE1A|nr:pyridoxamine 5'-phosphate oxidase-domain-containing protein [Zychaea mexicana]KAI9496520.1 pyridoxamine 5'-phosphate oxidase-domain-containing protein [Zychaea mexicana]